MHLLFPGGLTCHSFESTAGQIGYSLAPMIARGAMLGPDQPVILHLLDIERAAAALDGVKMELIDAALPLLHGKLFPICMALNITVTGSFAGTLCMDLGPGGVDTKLQPMTGQQAIKGSQNCWYFIYNIKNSSVLVTCPAAGVVVTTDLETACKDIDVAVMVGGFPRMAGMERKDVMAKNVTIYRCVAAGRMPKASAVGGSGWWLVRRAWSCF